LKTILAYIGFIILALLLVTGLTWFGNSLGLWQFSFFAPRIEAVRYNTFQQSQSYNEGMIRDLEDIQLQWNAATPEQKSVLRAVALHRFEVYPLDHLPPDLQNFYQQLKDYQQ